MSPLKRDFTAFLTAAIIGLGPRAVAQGAAGVDLPLVTIKEAVEAALSAGDELRIAELTLESARAQADQARSKAGLSLSGSGSYSLTDVFGRDLSGSAASSLSKLVGSEGASHALSGSLALSAGNVSSTSPYSKLTLSISESLPTAPSPATTTMGAALAQTIWDGYPGGQTRASIEKAAIALQGKELAAAQSRSTIAANVKKAYVTALTAQRTIVLRTSALEKQTATLRQIEATYALQQASAVDLMTARVNARAAELDLEAARHDLEIARRALAALTGRDPAVPFAVVELEEPELPAASIEEAVAVGVERRSDSAQIALSRRSAAIDLALARGASQPSVSASAGLSMGIVGGSAPGDAYQASLGAKISLPILDSGAAAAQVAAAQAQIAIYDAQARALSKGIERDIRDAYWMASILRERVSVAAESRDMYEKKLELVRTQLQYGTATNQDLLGAQVDAANAGAAYLKAKGDYLLQEIALETAMGL